MVYQLTRLHFSPRPTILILDVQQVSRQIVTFFRDHGCRNETLHNRIAALDACLHATVPQDGFKLWLIQWSIIGALDFALDEPKLLRLLIYALQLVLTVQ